MDAFRERPFSPTAQLVFLSARPESYRGWTEELSFRELFEPLIASGRLPGPPMLLLGSIRSGPLALWDYSGLARGVSCVPLLRTGLARVCLPLWLIKAGSSVW